MSTIQVIYAHHVLHGLGSFEEVPPDVDEMLRRRADILGRGLPYLVAELDGAIAGYAYAGSYRPRPAYRYTVENSVYVAPGKAGQGVGRALLADLVAQCAATGARQMIAVIGDSGNAGSIALHASQGFAYCGLLRAVGFKHGRWVDSVIMQRALGPGDCTLPDGTPAR
ncbi:MAG: GNAT family N-acetyltransferase [Alphaproteobacteria bacterium]